MLRKGLEVMKHVKNISFEGTRSRSVLKCLNKKKMNKVRQNEKTLI